MEAIKINATEIQAEIEDVLSETLTDMNKKVRTKRASLQSDRQEFVRQLTEIYYVEEFFKQQSVHADPLEFLQLSSGHKQIEKAIHNNHPKMSADLNDGDKDLMKLTVVAKIQFID